MNRSKLLVVPALVASAALVAAPAEAATLHITPKLWHVYQGGVKHNVPLGGTYLHCGSVASIYLKTRVTHAQKNHSFKESWFKDGVLQETDTFVWSANGAFTEYFGWQPAGGNIPDGVWKVRVFKAGKTLVQNHVTLSSTC